MSTVIGKLTRARARASSAGDLESERSRLAAIHATHLVVDDDASTVIAECPAGIRALESESVDTQNIPTPEGETQANPEPVHQHTIGGGSIDGGVPEPYAAGGENPQHITLITL